LPDSTFFTIFSRAEDDEDLDVDFFSSSLDFLLDAEEAFSELEEDEDRLPEFEELLLAPADEPEEERLEPERDADPESESLLEELLP
jgi:esterase/lipase superfamily enzyme